MRPDMITASPTNDLPRLPRDAFVEGTSQPFGNLAVTTFLACQVIAKLAAENRLHCGLPKTSWNVRPESWPETKFLNR